jgi:hypothetical protein
MAPFWGAAPWEYAVAPDGSFWAGWDVHYGGNDIRCQGVSRFDGTTWTRYLADMCINRLDIAPDGAVWLLAQDEADTPSTSDSQSGLYLITPEAVAARE